jgi:hypothetical protein
MSLANYNFRFARQSRRDADMPPMFAFGPVASTGRRNTARSLLAGDLEAQGVVRALIEPQGHFVSARLREAREICFQS